MNSFCKFITNPDWWSVIATFVAAIVAAWITYMLGKRQNKLQEQQLKLQERQNEIQEQQVKLQEQQNKIQLQQIEAQEYELYRRMYALIVDLDFFNKTILHKIVVILITNEEKNLRLKLIEEMYNEYNTLNEKLTEYSIDIELKQCGQGIDVKYYYDALRACHTILQMFKVFIEDDLLIFDKTLIHYVPIDHTLPPEKYLDIILGLYRGRNEQQLRDALLACAEVVKKLNKAQLSKTIKERITPSNKQ